MFVSRRLIFVVLVILCLDLPLLQLMATFCVCTAKIIYLLWFMPFEETLVNLLEVMNEITTILMLYVMLTFSDWVPSPELRYQLGWIFIGVLVLNTVVHIYFLISGLYREWRLKWRRDQRRRRAEKAEKSAMEIKNRAEKARNKKAKQLEPIS